MLAALGLALLAQALHAAPEDLCDPKLLTPALLKTLSPAEQRCIWRHLRKDVQGLKTYEGFLIEVNAYGSQAEAKVFYQQSSSEAGKRKGKLKLVAASAYQPDRAALEAWSGKMAGLKGLKKERIFVPGMEDFEGHALIRCEHRSMGRTRYTEWMDSETGLVLRAAGYDEEGRLFFARLYSHVTEGQALKEAPNFEASRTKLLAQDIGSLRLENAGDAGPYLEKLRPQLDLLLKK